MKLKLFGLAMQNILRFGVKFIMLAIALLFFICIFVISSLILENKIQTILKDRESNSTLKTIKFNPKRSKTLDKDTSVWLNSFDKEKFLSLGTLYYTFQANLSINENQDNISLNSLSDSKHANYVWNIDPQYLDKYIIVSGNLNKRSIDYLLKEYDADIVVQDLDSNYSNAAIIPLKIFKKEYQITSHIQDMYFEVNSVKDIMSAAKYLEDAGYITTYALKGDDTLVQTEKSFVIMQYIISILAVIIFGILCFILYLQMYRDRYLDFGILRAIGFSKENIVYMMALELMIFVICVGVISYLSISVLTILYNLLFSVDSMHYITIEYSQLIAIYVILITLMVLVNIYNLVKLFSNQSIDLLRSGY